MARWYTNYERPWSAFDELRRRMEALMEQVEPSGRLNLTGSWPQTNIYDNGEALVVEAVVPGVKNEDINLVVHEDVLTLSGERKPETFEGYTVHRAERRPIKFSRSFTLPTQVDFDKSYAQLKNGVLLVMLPKTPEAQPKRISVKAQ
jgi:HSP20 family protein